MANVAKKLSDKCQQSGLPKGRLGELHLSPLEAASLELSIQDDAMAFLYAASVALANAFVACRYQAYSWAVVSLYYSCLHSSRAYMCSKNIAVTYVNRTPLVWRIASLESPVKGSGSSHDAIIDYCSKNFGNQLGVDADIELENPLAWFRRHREEANYRVWARRDPKYPDILEFVVSNGIRRSIEMYLHDLRTYTYDPDHAVWAFALHLHREVSQSLIANMDLPDYTRAELAMFRSMCSDRKGVVAKFVDQLVLQRPAALPKR